MTNNSKTARVTAEPIVSSQASSSFGGENTVFTGTTPQDKVGDGFTNVEEYLNGTNSTEFVDYTKSENNINTLEESNAN